VAEAFDCLVCIEDSGGLFAAMKLVLFLIIIVLVVNTIVATIMGKKDFDFCLKRISAQPNGL